MANRNYQNTYPSVTTVLGVLRKPGLENWFKYNTAQFCDKKTNLGKIIGTQIHSAIEEIINTGQAKIETNHGAEVVNALNGFVLFRKEHPEFTLKNSELEMTSEKYKCNGTMDCEAEENSLPVLFDWKSGECKKEDKPTIYDEMKYQVAAYVHFFNEVKNSNVEKAYVLVLAKDKVSYNFYPMDKKEIDSHFFNAFLPAFTIWSHQHKERGK